MIFFTNDMEKITKDIELQKNLKKGIGRQILTTYQIK